MTPEDIKTKITELETAAQGLGEPEKTFKLNDVAQLRIQLEGMALQDLVAKLNQMALPDIEEMDRKIADARKATEDQQFRVDAFNTALGFIKTAVGIIL
ncbi:MAG: hypothetical protein QGF20_14640 [Alphaproteobacteria bacterium]|jgi:hypothetical protein|nr:hypothetical protein [Alphaproteobacteria bacterium]|tara:strand:+ start:230 stop:526 length:297 start_codon:yes stop_codon:yes gene_type:complete